MSAFNRFKEYFGMSPVAAYDDDYLDEYDRPARPERAGHDRRADYGYHDAYDEARRPRYDDHHDALDDYGPSRLGRPVGRVDDEPAPRPRRYAAPEMPERAPLRTVGATRGAVALAPEEDDFDDGLVTAPETVVERPRGFGDGKGLGENFRAGRAVVLDLTGMAPGDARRMVDFAAGLVFGLDGRMQKVSDRERTFLLQPAGMDLTEAEVRETVSDAFRR